MKKLILSICALVMLAGVSAQANGQDKGGGMVMGVKGTYHLYDFVENGLENTATAAPPMEDHCRL